jgi:hypothetical protein
MMLFLPPAGFHVWESIHFEQQYQHSPLRGRLSAAAGLQFAVLSIEAFLPLRTTSWRRAMRSAMVAKPAVEGAAVGEKGDFGLS